MPRKKKLKLYSHGEEEGGYWGTVGRVQRAGSVHNEFEVTGGHPVENPCWKLEKPE